MGELQATIEFSVELVKFINIDLFQRGFYQIRSYLKTSSKIPTKVEISYPKSLNSGPPLTYPACVLNGSAASKTFQVLYRNEEVDLNDVIIYHVDMLVASQKVVETLEKADFQLILELWFSEQSLGNQPSNVVCVSSRTLHVHFSPLLGIHYHLPVWFDYFHLSAISVSVHGSLLAIHQSVMSNSQKKTSLGSGTAAWSQAGQISIEDMFFSSMGKCLEFGTSRIAHACRLHKELCTVLLSAFESLDRTIRVYSEYAPVVMGKLNKAVDKEPVPSKDAGTSKKDLNAAAAAVDCVAKLRALTDRLKNSDDEDKVLAMAESDIAHLCGQNILLWQQFLEAVSKSEPVRSVLARHHHQQRVKRFSEGFFIIDNPRPSMAGCYDCNYQNYLLMADYVRRSKYFNLLPRLTVECLELDGDPSLVPIIFEDQYQDVKEFARRRSVATHSSDNASAFEVEIGVDVASILARNQQQTSGVFGSDSGFGSSVASRISSSSWQNRRLADVNAINAEFADQTVATTTPATATANGSHIPATARRQRRLNQLTHYNSLQQPSSSSSRSKQPPARSVSSCSARDGGGGSSTVVDVVFGTAAAGKPKPTVSASVSDPGRRFGTYPSVPVRARRKKHSSGVSAVSSASRDSGIVDGAGTFRSVLSSSWEVNGGVSGGAGEVLPAGEGVATVMATATATTCPGCLSEKLSEEKQRRASKSDVAAYANVRDGHATRVVSPTTKCFTFPKPKHAFKKKFRVADGREDVVGRASVEVRSVSATASPPDSSSAKSSLRRRKLKLMAQNRELRKHLGSRYHAKSATSPSSSSSTATDASSESVVLVGYKKIEQSVSYPFNLCLGLTAAMVAASDGGGGGVAGEAGKPRRCSTSVVEAASSSSVRTAASDVDVVRRRPSVWEVRRLLRGLPSSESMPNLNEMAAIPPPRKAAFVSLCNLLPKRENPSCSSVAGTSAAAEDSGREKPDVDEDEEDGYAGEGSTNSEHSGWVSNSSSSPTTTDAAKSSNSTPSESRKDGGAARTEKGGKRATAKEGEIVIPPVPPPVEFQDGVGSPSNDAGAAPTYAPRVNGVGVGGHSHVLANEIMPSLPPKEFRDPVPVPVPVPVATVDPATAPVKLTRAATVAAANCSAADFMAAIAVSVSSRKLRGTSDDDSIYHIYEAVNEMSFGGAHWPRSLTSSVLRRTAASTPVLYPGPEPTDGICALAPGAKSSVGGRRTDPARAYRATTEPPSSSSSLRVVGDVDCLSVVGTGTSERRRGGRSGRGGKGYLADSSKSKSVCEDASTADWREEDLAAIIPRLTRKCSCSSDSQILTKAGLVCECCVSRRAETSVSVSVSSGGDPGDAVVTVDSLGYVTRRQQRRSLSSTTTATASPASSSLVSHSSSSSATADAVAFVKAREDFRAQMKLGPGTMYSDYPVSSTSLPYFHVSDEHRVFHPAGLHLVVCVHGLDGNAADLRLVRAYLEMGLPGVNLEFIMSERNQGDTFSDFDTMTDRLVAEILYNIDASQLKPARISFVGHSLGTVLIRSALSRPQMKPLLPKLHTFLSLSGPHLGTLYNNSGLVNMGLWFMQKVKKSGSLLQLSLKDHPDPRQTFLYKLAKESQLHQFKNILLCGSSQDRYVPMHSARIELCKAAARDSSVLGSATREMVSSILQPIIAKPEVTLVRYDVHHALPATANSLIGRAAHIAVLDSELFIEKFFVVSALKYFE